MRVVAASVLLLVAAGIGPAAAQSPVALRAAMLYGVAPTQSVDVGSFVQPDPPVDRMQPLPALAPSDTLLDDPWLGRDKFLHAAGSFLLTLSAQYVLTSKLDTDEDTAVPIAAGASFSLGLAKEVADSRRPVRPLFSTRDLVADAVGVALAVGLILL